MKLLFSHNETPSIIITMEVDDLPIELEVADALKSGHLMMGTAESCTGGKIASMITSMAGSSEYFTGGVVAYCNEVKHHVLGVSEADLNTFGAVSQPVVEQMARGTMRVLGCDCAVATSGIAGPGGGTPRNRWERYGLPPLIRRGFSPSATISGRILVWRTFACRQRRRCVCCSD